MGFCDVLCWGEGEGKGGRGGRQIMIDSRLSGTCADSASPLFSLCLRSRGWRRGSDNRAYLLHLRRTMPADLPAKGLRAPSPTVVLSVLACQESTSEPPFFPSALPAYSIAFPSGSRVPCRSMQAYTIPHACFTPLNRHSVFYHNNTPTRNLGG